MDNKIIVPVKIGQKLKFPLHKSVLLFMSSGKIYSCCIVFAGKDFVKVNKIQERIIDENKCVKYIDLQLPDYTIFSRDKIEGYSPNEYKTPQNSSAKVRLIKTNSKGCNKNE